MAEVRLDGQNNPVLILRRKQSREYCRAAAVVVFVPDDHDRVVSRMPRRRCMDGFDQVLDGGITLLDESGVDSYLGTVGIPFFIKAVVECAEGIAIASPVLIVALVGRDERKIRNAAVRQVRVKSPGAIEP